MKLERFLLLALAAACVAATPQARAISAFSRQYDVECSTCHDPYPHRTEFGEAFLRNGYVWPGSHVPKRAAVKESHWVAGIPESVPLSLSVRQDLNWNEEAATDEVTPDSRIQLHAGGNIRGAVGFFAHDLLADRTEAFAVFRLREFSPLPLNVRYGRIVPHTTLNKPNQNYLSAPPAALTLSVAGEPPLGAVRDGIELDFLPASNLYLALGVADRKGQNPMDGYAHASLKFGGTDYGGNEPEVDFDDESVWDFLSLTLAGYYYTGWSAAIDDEYYRAGGDLEVRYGGFSFGGSYLFGRDHRDADGKRVASAVWSAQGVYTHMSRWLTGVRLEWIDQGNAAQGIVERGVAIFGFTPLQNLWLKLEAGGSRSEKGSDRVVRSADLLLSYHL